jgi:hypothetical protein
MGAVLKSAVAKKSIRPSSFTKASEKAPAFRHGDESRVDFELDG